MKTTGIKTLEIVERVAVKGTEKHNNSQLKGKSYSIFKKISTGEYEVLHNRTKENEDLKQIAVFGYDGNILLATSCHKLKEVEVLFNKETLQEIAWKLNDKFANDKLDTKKVVVDYDFDNNKMVEVRLEKKQNQKVEISNTEKDKINNKNNKNEKKMETTGNSNKKVKDFHGVLLSENEKSVFLTILTVMNGDWDDVIYSKSVTDGSLSVSGTISMLNRKGLVNCEKQKINGGRKLPTISLTILGKSIAPIAIVELPSPANISQEIMEEDIEAALGLEEFEKEAQIQSQELSAVEEVDDDIC